MVASQNSFGELYQDLLRGSPIPVSSDEDVEVTRRPQVSSHGDRVKVSEEVENFPNTRGRGGDGAREATSSQSTQAALQDPIESTPTTRDSRRIVRYRTPRPTRWGRCERCGAPMRPVIPSVNGLSAFLGCTEYKSKALNTCRFTRAVPPDRYHELPENAIVRRRVET